MSTSDGIHSTPVKSGRNTPHVCNRSREWRGESSIGNNPLTVTWRASVRQERTTEDGRHPKLPEGAIYGNLCRLHNHNNQGRPKRSPRRSSHERISNRPEDDQYA